MILTEKMSGTTFRVQKTLAESIMTESPELIETIIANPEIRRVAEEFWKDIGRLLTAVQESKTEEVVNYIKDCQDRFAKHTDINDSYKKLTKMVKVVEKIKNMRSTKIVTSFIEDNNKFLILKRSNKVKSMKNFMGRSKWNH